MKIISTITNEHELFSNNHIFTKQANNIGINYLWKTDLKPHFKANIYLQSTLFIFILNGKGYIEVNFKKRSIGSNDLILLSFGHFFRFSQLSDDFKCISLYIPQSFINKMYSTDMIYRRVKYGVRMFQMPFIHLSYHEFALLRKRLTFINEIIHTANHRYINELTLNALRIYLLDLSNIIESSGSVDYTKQSREEIYFQKFLSLLSEYYKAEHLVDFYAKKIHITSHYLTLIVKKLSGQTVSDFIFQLLFGEAKLLLGQPAISIQEIAFNLNFSDQSSFGKFFKRKSGMSPKDYRKTELMK